MDIVETLGKIAGIGGIALGVFLLLFKDVIRKNIFPKLQDHQAYRIIMLFLVLTFSVAAMGLASYVYVTTRDNAGLRRTPGNQKAPTFAEQQATDLEREIVTLVGRWDNSDNSPKDKQEVMDKAPALAKRMELLGDEQLRPAWRIVKLEYGAYALVMAASTAPTESALDRNAKNHMPKGPMRRPCKA